MDIRREYPGFEGNARWILITDLSEEELKRKFPQEMKAMYPYVILKRRCAQPITAYVRNESKFKKRYMSNTLLMGNMRELNGLLYRDTGCSECDDRHDVLMSALYELTDMQRHRMIEHFFYEKPVRVIAAEEHVGRSSVQESLSAGLEKMRIVLLSRRKGDDTPAALERGVSYGR